MSWEEFAKLGIGGLEYCILEKADDTDKSVDDTDGIDGTEETDEPDSVENNTPAGDFKDMGALQSFVHSPEAINYVANALGINLTQTNSDYMNMATDIANKHKDDISTVTKSQILEELKNAYEKILNVQKPEEPAPPASDFGSYTELRNFIFSNEARSIIKEKGLLFNKGFVYEQIADAVAKSFEKDFASVTKEQLIEAFITEYNKRAAGSNDSTNGTDETDSSNANGADKPETPANPANAPQNILDALNNLTMPNTVEDIITNIVNGIKNSSKSGNNKYIDSSYSVGNDGIIKFNSQELKNAYDKLLKYIKDAVKNLGYDEAVLDKLFQSAWIMSNPTNSHTNRDSNNLLNDVYANFKKILTSIQSKPEYLDYYSQVNSENFTNTASVSKIKSTYQTEDGVSHLSDNASDAVYQKQLKETFEQLCAKYPDIPQDKIKEMLNRSQKSAFEKIKGFDAWKNNTNIPKNLQGSNAKLADLMSFIMSQFNKIMYEELAKGSIQLSGNSKMETRTYTEEEKSLQNKIKNGADKVIAAIDNTQIDSKYNYNDWLTMNRIKNGKLVFTDKDTQKAYEDVFNTLCSKPDFKNSGISKDELKLIYDSAWMMCTIGRDNNRKYNLQTILKEVLDNMKKILNKVKTNPEYMNIVKNTISAYSDTPNKNGKTVLKYGNTDTKLDYGDGNVHLGDDNSDKIYQKYIEQLRSSLKQRYCPPLSEEKFDRWFTQAQKDAFNACANNSRDIFNEMQVDDGTRHKDGWKIWVDEIMELITYNFQKQMFKEMFK